MRLIKPILLSALLFKDERIGLRVLAGSAIVVASVVYLVS